MTLILSHHVLSVLKTLPSHQSNIVAVFQYILYVGLWQLNYWDRNKMIILLKAGHFWPTCLNLSIDSIHVRTSM